MSRPFLGGEKMKAVLMAIHPKWCEKIFSGEKTVEVRKTAPKLKPPYKVYVYQTKEKEPLLEVIKDGDDLYGEIYHGEIIFVKGYRPKGKVVGEFICDKIGEIDYVMYWNNGYEIATRLAYRECADYGKGKPLYGWHITKPKRYDTPKELSEFRKPDEPFHTVEINENGNIGFCDGYIDGEPITRPPQSWQYVEELC